MSALCGFTGARDDRFASAMQSRLAHRVRGAWQDVVRSQGSVFYGPELGWSGEQGGVVEEGDACLAFAGFLTQGQGDLTAADLLHGFLRKGEQWLTTLRGAFVLALMSGERLYLMRDGVGARSLYYARHQGRIFFGIEPKAIWGLPGFSRRLRPEALARFLSFSFQPTHETMLEDVHAVLPGQLLRWDAQGQMHETRFFRFEDFETEAPHEPDPHWLRRFDDDLQAAISDRLKPGEPVGAFLSGGIDSSAIVAALRRASHPVKTYAVHFGEDLPHELDFAREVAERCGSDHEEVLLRPKDFLSELRRIVYLLDDPIGDPVTVPNFWLAKWVSREFRGIFNGEGGDPCFGGPKNLTMMLSHWYGVPRGPLYYEQQYLKSYRRAYEELPFLLNPDYLARIDTDQALCGVLTPLLHAEHPTLLLNRLMSINIRLKGAQLILPKVERMLGVHGVTPLSPLFDERLVALSFAMPPHLKLHQGVEKVIIKEVFRDQLPESVIQRPKSGMRVPVHYWFKDDMRRYAKSILSKRQLKRAGIFNPDRVKQLLSYDMEGLGRFGLKLWMLITFEIWRRIVIEGESA